MTYRSSACAKIILLGEHAVVYGFPAVAVPVRSLRATAEYDVGPPPLRIEAPDIGLRAVLEDLPAENPLGFCIRHTLDVLHIPLSGGRLRVTSDIPVASGMGSGASVSTAVARALAAAAGKTVDAEQVSTIVYEVERIHHGTPSGVDNTVIAYEQPVYFVRGKGPEILVTGGSMLFLIADSGVRSATRDAVAGVRERRNNDPERYDRVFQSIGELTDAGRACLEAGDRRMLGRAMFESHGLLDAIGVGTPGLTRLVDAARFAGAWGAKLSGAGMGGNVIALVEPETAKAAEAALRAAGASAVFRTVVEPGNNPPSQAKSPHGT